MVTVGGHTVLLAYISPRRHLATSLPFSFLPNPVRRPWLGDGVVGHAVLGMLVGGWGLCLLWPRCLCCSQHSTRCRTEGWQHRFGCFTPVSVPCRGSCIVWAGYHIGFLHRFGRDFEVLAVGWQYRFGCSTQHSSLNKEPASCRQAIQGLGCRVAVPFLTASPMAVVPSLLCKVAVSFWLHYLLHWCLCVVS